MLGLLPTIIRGPFRPRSLLAGVGVPSRTRPREIMDPGRWGCRIDIRPPRLTCHPEGQACRRPWRQPPWRLPRLGRIRPAYLLVAGLARSYAALFPAGETGGIATPAAQQASARCSSAADTPAAALRRKMAARHDHERNP